MSLLFNEIKVGIYAGSFDPLTTGHAYVIQRARCLFDRVIIAIGTHDSKKSWLEASERCLMINRWIDANCTDTVVMTFEDLLVSFVQRIQSKYRRVCLVRGVRSEADFTYEMQMADANFALGNVETILIPTKPALSYVSSTLVREIVRHGGSCAQFVPAEIAEAINQKIIWRVSHDPTY